MGDKLVVALSPTVPEDAVFTYAPMVDAKLVDHRGQHVKTIRTSAGIVKGHLIKDKAGGCYQVLGVLHLEDQHRIEVAVVEVEDPPQWYR